MLGEIDPPIQTSNGLVLFKEMTGEIQVLVSGVFFGVDHETSSDCRATNRMGNPWVGWSHGSMVVFSDLCINSWFVLVIWMYGIGRL